MNGFNFKSKVTSRIGIVAVFKSYLNEAEEYKERTAHGLRQIGGMNEWSSARRGREILL